MCSVSNLGPSKSRKKSILYSMRVLYYVRENTVTEISTVTVLFVSHASKAKVRSGLSYPKQLKLLQEVHVQDFGNYSKYVFQDFEVNRSHLLPQPACHALISCLISCWETHIYIILWAAGEWRAQSNFLLGYRPYLLSALQLHKYCGWLAKLKKEKPVGR